MMRAMCVAIAVIASAGCKRPLAPGETRCTSAPVFGTVMTKCETGPNHPQEVVMREVPAPAPAPTSPPPPPPQPERAADGRAIVYGNEPQWCYVDNEGLAGGDCMDTKEACQKLRIRAIGFTFAEHTEALIKRNLPDEEARKAGSAYAIQRWRQCEPAPWAACFYWKDVLSGLEARMCNPTIASCEQDREESRRDRGLVLRNDGCIVYRVR